MSFYCQYCGMYFNHPMTIGLLDEHYRESCTPMKRHDYNIRHECMYCGFKHFPYWTNDEANHHLRTSCTEKVKEHLRRADELAAKKGKDSITPEDYYQMKNALDTAKDRIKELEIRMDDFMNLFRNSTNG